MNELKTLFREDMENPDDRWYFTLKPGKSRASVDFYMMTAIEGEGFLVLHQEIYE